MTYQEEQELLQLTKENNQLLKAIYTQVSRNDFIENLVANVIGNRLTYGNN